MQHAGPAIGSQPVPIEQPKRRVARLLHFGQQHAAADRVDRAGLEQQAISHPRHERVQTIADGPLLQMLDEHFPAGSRLQAGVDSPRRVDFEHDPGFGFAQLAGNQPLGRRVVGMHLHREQFVAIEVLHQERKPRRHRAGAVQLAGQLATELGQRLAPQRPLGHAALVMRVGVVSHDSPYWPAGSVLPSVSSRRSPHTWGRK